MPGTPADSGLDLARLGWDAAWQAVLDDLGEASVVPARVVGEDRHTYAVVSSRGELLATLTGRFLHGVRDPSQLPRIGDWVALAPVPGEAKGMIRHLLPRRTRLGRRLPGRETQEQVLAANVDRVFIVQSLDANFNPRRLERFLMMAHDGGVQPVVLLNKADLCDDIEARVAEARAVCGDATVLVTSVRRRRGLRALAATINPAQTVAFIGSSGVGKSSLINCLYGEAIHPTLEVRSADSKGRHATTWRELVPLPGGGLVVDTPGLREVQAWLDEEGLREAFPEVEALAATCRFRDCRHEMEPGCAVRAAANAGTLSPQRLESFRKLQREHRTLASDRQERVYVTRQRQGRSRRQVNARAEDDDE